MINLKKLPSSRIQALRPAKLYMDDLQKILAAFHEVSSEVEIQAEGFSLDNLTQLTDLRKDSITTLQIGCHKPYASIEFKKDSTYLYIAQDDTISTGLFHKVKQIVATRQRPLTWLYANPIVPNLPFTLAGPAFALGIHHPTTNWPLISLGITLVLLALVLNYSFYRSFSRHSIIIPKYQIDSPSIPQAQCRQHSPRGHLGRLRRNPRRPNNLRDFKGRLIHTSSLPRTIPWVTPTGMKSDLVC